jgi:hypothetical protein
LEAYDHPSAWPSSHEEEASSAGNPYQGAWEVHSIAWRDGMAYESAEEDAGNGDPLGESEPSTWVDRTS